MINNRTFFWLLSVLLILLILLEIWAPKPVDWTPTLGYNDKAPYGTFILQNELQQRFIMPQGVENRTFFEICSDNQHDLPRAIVSFSTVLSLDSLDADALMQYVVQGGVAFISASEIYGALADTLGIETWGSGVGSLDLSQITPKDSVTLHFVNSHLFPDEVYQYLSPAVYTYFTAVDTFNTEVLAINNQKYPVMLRIKKGAGYFLLNTTPLSFSNFYMLRTPNEQYAAKALSYLPAGSLLRTEYYQKGRLEPSSPLRFIVSHPALKTAYYLTLISLVLFVVFEAKRRQKVIPVIPPLRNTTLDFTQTLGRLYFEQGDHSNIAHKMINYFLEDIRTHYYLATNQIDESFLQLLSSKSNKDLTETRDLFAFISSLEGLSQISDDQLKSLNYKINRFREGSQIHMDYGR